MSVQPPEYERTYQRIKDELFLLVVQGKVTDGQARFEALAEAYRNVAPLPLVNDVNWVMLSGQRTVINTTGWAARDVQLLNDIADLIAKR